MRNQLKKTNIALVAAVNDQAVLRANLLRSPDAGNMPLHAMEGFSSAGTAYNAALENSGEDILVFVHQDVYLPAGWLDGLRQTVGELEKADPKWAVLGVIGVDSSGKFVGRTYSCGLGKVVGRQLDEPVAVQSLDEVVLVLRRASGVSFDAALPGFHLYGTDVCQIARSEGLNCYSIDAFCVHNSRGILMLPPSFWSAYDYLAEKWPEHCPLRTPCTTISPRLSLKMRQRWYDLRRHVLRRTSPGQRVSDPEALYQDLMEAV